MRNKLILSALLLASAAAAPAPLCAAVVILANRSAGDIAFAVTTAPGKPEQHELVAGYSLTVTSKATVVFTFITCTKLRCFYIAV